MALEKQVIEMTVRQIYESHGIDVSDTFAHNTRAFLNRQRQNSIQRSIRQDAPQGAARFRESESTALALFLLREQLEDDGRPRFNRKKLGSPRRKVHNLDKARNSGQLLSCAGRIRPRPHSFYH